MHFFGLWRMKVGDKINKRATTMAKTYVVFGEMIIVAQDSKGNICDFMPSHLHFMNRRF
jgi:hypothetical protein